MLICVLKFATDGVQSVRFAWFQPKGGRINLLAQLVQRHDGSWSMMKRSGRFSSYSWHRNTSLSQGWHSKRL
ncbi:hypothetical protein PC114_g19055 [Phytophthora cactorum]|uniref:Uncharacterized protein n=1 Tax=Phytophthora cactorum TaxID=29920 RepID=A0A8T1C6L2_9STRA|nr:hypothetical protein PC114_g19055 [Phytophthora cactorum]KAG2913614.1 hypothetical protein PC117_g18524 [Phytophthora cactorum]KAG3014675.1 hypothetical protein PC120_g12572 [Phytophthora cactorum]KAG3054420.1 hypothetical protein PC121_g16300 [Phytophthora cactorum]KAG3183990.1 hypothetical protein PC128_g13921 [Phytophthora cactorum]